MCESWISCWVGFQYVDNEYVVVRLSFVAIFYIVRWNLKCGKYGGYVDFFSYLCAIFHIIIVIFYDTYYKNHRTE